MNRYVRLCAALILMAWLAGWPADARAEEVSHAGLVVRDSRGALTFSYVGFAEPELSGMELLLRSGLDVVTVSFGGLGQGVCVIEQTGCPAAECRKRLCQGADAEDPFWKYFRQGEPGVWSEARLGANAAVVHDGDIDGWSWTGTDAELPALTLADVAQRAGYDGSGFDAAGAPTGAVHRREGGALPDAEATSPVVFGLGITLLGAGAAAVLGIVRRRQRRPAT